MDGPSSKKFRLDLDNLNDTVSHQEIFYFALSFTNKLKFWIIVFTRQNICILCIIYRIFFYVICTIVRAITYKIRNMS